MKKNKSSMDNRCDYEQVNVESRKPYLEVKKQTGGLDTRWEFPAQNLKISELSISMSKRTHLHKSPSH